MQQSNQLALLGGAAVTSELSYPSWPPRDDQTVDALLDVYWSGRWSFHGEQEQAFSDAFAAYHNAEYGVFVANGSVAIECALQACCIGPGDEVIVPAMTWPSTVLAPIEIGAVPVCVDIDPVTLCIDPQKIEAAITERTRAILLVHLYGSMAEMDEIMVLANRFHLQVIEDCAHLPGAKWNGQGIGSLGHVGTFAFSQQKSLSCGEGGLCLTNDAQIAERLYRVSHMGFGPNDIPFRKLQGGPPQDFLCHNFRATEFQATILLHQLAHLEQRIARYNANAKRLREAIEQMEGIRTQAPGRLASPQSYFGLGIIFDEEPLASVPLATILQALVAEGLQEGIQGIYRTYGPVYKHTLFTQDPSRYCIADGGCPTTEHLAAHSLVLPHQWLNADEHTIETLIAVFQKLSQQAQHLLTHI